MKRAVIVLFVLCASPAVAQQQLSPDQTKQAQEINDRLARRIGQLVIENESLEMWVAHLRAEADKAKAFNKP